MGLRRARRGTHHQEPQHQNVPRSPLPAIKSPPPAHRSPFSHPLTRLPQLINRNTDTEQFDGAPHFGELGDERQTRSGHEERVQPQLCLPHRGRTKSQCQNLFPLSVSIKQSSNLELERSQRAAHELRRVLKRILLQRKKTDFEAALRLTGRANVSTSLTSPRED
jgi:hypothetical protein